jgi:hypothetical protein
MRLLGDLSPLIDARGDQIASEKRRNPWTLQLGVGQTVGLCAVRFWDAGLRHSLRSPHLEAVRLECDGFGSPNREGLAPEIRNLPSARSSPATGSRKSSSATF